MNNVQNTPSKPPLQRLGDYLLQAVTWIRTHQEQSWALAGIVVIIIGAPFLVYNQRARRNADAWTQLGIAQGYLIQNNYSETTKALDQWATRFQGTAADGYAKFLKGDLLYRTSDYTTAALTYAALAQTAYPTELRPLAMAAQISAEEMAGRIPEALALAQQFLDPQRYADHFLAAGVAFDQARLAERAGQTTQAAGFYDRFVVLYPQSPAVPLARARLQALSTNTSKK